MGKSQDLQLHISVKSRNVSIRFVVQEAEPAISQPRNLKWWLCIATYTLFVLFGQSSAILLGRLYYNKGGESIWIATMVKFIGFPILIRYHCLSSSNKITTESNVNLPSSAVLAVTSLSFGVLLAADSMLYSIGLLYLPVSTFSLICASQLIFNAFFSFFLNSQNFTPYIVNSLVLLTISSLLLVFHANSMNVTGISKDKYMFGIMCTIGASAGYGLMFSLTQVAFQKFLKSSTFTAVLEIIIFESIVATCATLVGLFVSNEMKGLKREMEELELGRLFYFVTLVCTAAAWQAFNMGAIGLIFEVSALFSNVICVSGPFVPVLAVIFFNDSMDGIKVIATVLAIWGLASYLYQHCLDNSNSNSGPKPAREISMIPLLKETNCQVNE